MRGLAAALLLAFLAGGASAQQTEDMRFWVEADPPSMRPGEEFTLTIRSEVPWDFGIHVPRSFDFLGPFAVVEGFQAVPVELGDRRRSFAHYRLQAPAETGSLEIPSMTAYVQLVRRPPPSEGCEPLEREMSEVERFYEGCYGISRARGFRMEVGERFTMESSPLVVVVHEHVPPDADTLAPLALAAPVSLPEVGGIPGAWGWGFSAAAAAAALAALALRRRRSVEEEEEAPPAGASEEPASREALEAFGRINENLGRYAGSFRPVHEEIARVLRAYIDRRLAYPAPRRTTEETLEGLPEAVAREERLPAGALRKNAGSVLAACDEVKFADRAATRAETGNVLVLARRFVEASPEPAE